MNFLMARQASALKPELLLLTDGEGRDVGRLELPPLPQAKNARLRWHGDDATRGAVKLECHGQRSVIEFEYLTREWVSVVRYSLMADGAPLAVAEVQGPRVQLTQPLPSSLVRTHRCWRSRFELRAADGSVVGRVEEPSLLSATRTLRAELPVTFPVPLQAFVLFLASNQIQRQV